ncbi:MAG: HD domain-containing protein [Deltaproteobacteria bacterium]|jgi:HD-GYP domain-containing protein (c-di-GMP phosphodiesterase class II)|nr:HD domain-containing protein [Deltaproteobacteria bacterium]
MSEKESGDKHSPGEVLLHNLFRLIQVVKIHQSNNRLFADIVAAFKAALAGYWATGRPAAFILYRGRFFLNDERIVFSPSMWTTSVKMSEFFQERSLSGLKFEINEEVTDQAIVSLVDFLNKAKRFPEPFEWLRSQLSEDLAWVVPTKEDDSTLPGGGSSQTAGGGRQVAVRPEAQSELKRQARQIYSQGLTVMRTLVTRLDEGKKVGIQKAKRVVQELIDLMSEDMRLYLALSTIRDHGDQIFTHSLNVAVLSIALAWKVGYSKVGLEQLGLIALFHDLGKTGDFLAAVDKPDTLEGHDLAVVQNHPLGSIARIIRLNAGYNLKLSMLHPVGEHHLGLDLTGYPKTKRTRPLTLGGRILAVADQYDAMTSWRPWRAEPLSPSMAIQTMVEISGRSLDPLVVRLFVEMMGPWPVGSILVLDSRELALTEAVLPGEGPYPPAFTLLKNEDGTVSRGPKLDLSGASGDKRRIVGDLNPAAYGLQPADYLL